MRKLSSSSRAKAPSSKLHSTKKKVSAVPKLTLRSTVSKVAAVAKKAIPAATARAKASLSKAPAPMPSKVAPKTASSRPARGFSATTSSSKVRGLSSAQLKDLEARLLSFEREIKNALDDKSTSFNIAAHTESVIKGDDAEVAEKQRASNAALQELDILKTRLQLVRRALAKMEAGVYGICEETEEPIGYERLSVVPWARFAVHVQEIHERRLRDFRVNRLRSEA